MRIVCLKLTDTEYRCALECHTVKGSADEEALRSYLGLTDSVREEHHCHDHDGSLPPELG